MGKRSDFKRNARDKYDTPYSCVLPLIPHLKYTNYIEPCAGKGWLMDHLEKHGMNCVGAVTLSRNVKTFIRLIIRHMHFTVPTQIA